MEIIWDKVITADLIVFVTPLYYFGMSAQLKKVIDRFYAINDLLRSKLKKVILLATCAEKESWAMDALVAHFKAICRYFQWEEAGKILAFGMSERKDIEASEYPAMAYALGKYIQ